MCDEYDDERMAVFWRTLAERKALEAPVSEGEDAPRDPIVTPLDPPALSRVRAKPLVR